MQAQQGEDDTRAHVDPAGLAVVQRTRSGGRKQQTDRHEPQWHDQCHHNAYAQHVMQCEVRAPGSGMTTVHY